MNKYIPAEKLIAEIKRRRGRALKRQKNLEKIGQETVLNKAIAFELNIILSFITFLQQEQRNPNLENEIKAYTETLYHEIFGNGQGTLDEFDWEDITQVIDDTARYFYDLNKNDE